MTALVSAVCAVALALASLGATSDTPTDPQQASSAILRGQATWYDGPTGSAAAGPALRRWIGPGWRGASVDVCRSGTTWITCVRVRLTDWCACSGDRIIDLDDRAFAQLADLSKGVIRVRVALGAPPRETITQPPTDTEETP